MSAREGHTTTASDSPYRKRPLDGAAEEEKGSDTRFKRQAVIEVNDKSQEQHRRSTSLGGKSASNLALDDIEDASELQQYEDLGLGASFSEDQEEVKRNNSVNEPPDTKNSPHSSGAVSEDEDTSLTYPYCSRSMPSSAPIYSRTQDGYFDEQRNTDDSSNIPLALSEHGPASGAPGVSSTKVQKSLTSSGYGQSNSRPTITRCIITSKEAGVIIGKHGKNIADIRETSGAKVMISEQAQGTQDRILTISGPIGSTTKAFLSISQIVSEETQSDDIPPRSTIRKATIKLLIPHIKMGIIIGKSGSRIREIQEQSSARILASEEMLPSSTERVVTIIGSPESIQIAIYNIILTLQDFSGDEFSFIPYKPQPASAHSYLRMPGRGSLPHGGAVYGKQHMPFPIQANHPEHLQAYYNQFDVGQHNYQIPRSQISLHAPHPSAYQSIQLQQIFIPNEMVGSIIGKQGCKINEIRQLSGCHIKIAEARHASPDRLVTIIGSAEANQMALFLLYDRLEGEKSRLESMRNSATTTRT